MRNKSKSSSLSTSTVGEIRNLDYSFLKQKNDNLAEELCHMKRVANNLQSDVNFMVKEKFHLEQRERFLKEYAADIDRRSRNCLNKIVECSTEVTVILKLCKNMVNIEKLWNRNEVSPSPTKSDSKDEDDVGEMLHPSNETNLQENGNDTTANRNDSQEKAVEPYEFPARGARRKSVSLALDIENFETEEEVPLPIQPSINQLDTINEDSEYHVSAEKEESNTQCLDDENTPSFFNSLPYINVNIRRGDKRLNNEDVSTIVEPDSQLYDSVNDDTIPKNVDENSDRKNSIGECSEWEETVVNTGEDSNLTPSGFNESSQNKMCVTSTGISTHLEEDGIKDTRSSLRRMSFIERRSIGSPHPVPSTSSIMRKSLPQKSLSISKNSDQHAPSDDSRKKKLPRISLFKNDTNSEELSKEKGTAEEQHHIKNVTNKEQEFNRKDLEHCLDKSLPFNDLSNTMLISSTPMIKSKNSMIEEQRSNRSKKSPERNIKRKTCAQSRRETLKEENNSMDVSNEMNETNKRIRRKCTFYKYNPFHRFEGNFAGLSPKEKSIALLEDYYRSLEIKEQRKLSRAQRKLSNMNDSNSLKETPKSKTKVVDRSRPLFNEGDEVEAHLEDHTEDTSHTADEDTPSSQKTKEISKNSSKKKRKRLNPVYNKVKKEAVMKSGISPLNNSGGRKRRRAVTNIVYKEPSLNKKLRREL